MEIKLTPKAAHKLKNLKEDNKYVRLGVKGGGCSGLSYTIAATNVFDFNDIIIDIEDVKILIDHKSLKFIEGMEIDYSTALNNFGFVFNNPNAKSKCGCGISFNY